MYRIIKVLAFSIVFSLFWSACNSQDIQGLLNTLAESGAKEVKDIGTGWKPFWIIFVPEKQNNAGILSSLSQSNAPSGLYYLQGKTILVGNNLYMVAMKPVPPSANIASILKNEQTSADPQKIMSVLEPKFSPKWKVSLSLLEISSIESMRILRNEDLTSTFITSPNNTAQSAIQAAILYPVFAHSRAKAQEAHSSYNLHELGQAAIRYAKIHKGLLPPMKNIAACRNALRPYNPRIDSYKYNGITGDYKCNASLSKKSLKYISQPALTILFYEPVFWQNDGRRVCFADGHVQSLNQAEWTKLSRMSHIPREKP